MSTGARRLLARQGRAHAGALAVVAAVVLVTSFLACSVPRVLSHVYDQGLRDTLVAAGPTGRDLTATASGYLPLSEDDDPLAAYDRATQALLADTDPSLADRVSGTTYSVTSELLTATVDLGGQARQDPATRLSLRAADDWQDHVDIVEGARPSGEIPPECVGPPDAPVDPRACVIEVALSADAAPEMQIAVGDIVPLEQGLPFGGGPVLTRVVALFEPVDAEADYWSRAGRALFPYQFISDDTGLNNEGIAFVAPRAYPFVQGQVIGISSSQVMIQLFTEPATFSSDDVHPVQRALDRLPASRLASADAPVITLQLRSQLDSVLEDYVAQRATADAVMSVALAGLLAVALAVLAMAARLVTERRRVTVRLAVARGASARQLAGWQAIEGLAVAAPAAVAGSVLTAVVVGGRGGRATVAVPLLLVLATAVLVPALGRAGSRGAGRRDLWRRWAGPGRLVLELSVVGVAVAAVLTLRRRGLTTSAVELGTDPLLVSVPVLLAVSVGIVVLRVFPIPLRSVGSLVARRGDAVPFLGLARSGRDVAGGTAPVIVLLLGLTMAVFTSVISATLARGGVEASWQSVGADLRLASAGYPDEAIEAAREVDGVAAVAPAAISYDGEFERRDVTVVATDIGAYRDVQRANPVGPPLPASLDGADALPAVVSSSLAPDGGPLTITLRDTELVLDVAATAPTLPGIPADADWVLVPLDRLREATGFGHDAETAYVALDPGTPTDPASLDRLTEDLTAALPGTAAVTTRAAEAREVADSGLVTGVRGLFAAGVVTGAAYATLAVVLTLVVTARQRDVVLSQLRTLGLSGRQARALVALEILPLAGAALVSGLLLGLATPWLLAPAIDLRPFTGSEVATPLTVDALSVTALAAGFAVVVGVAVLLVTAANRRRVLGSVLRVGEDA